MSKGLFDARRKFAQTNSLLRQGNALNAVQAFHGGLQDMLREPLLKSERTEFEELLGQIVKNIAVNQKVLSIFQLKLAYTPGQEKELLKNIRILLDALEAEVIDEAARRFMEMEADKNRRLAEGVAALEEGKTSRAKELFEALAKEHTKDVGLLVNMAEAYEKAGLLEEAAALLDQAAALEPGEAYIHNKRGIVFRKLKRFDDSEAAFNSALAVTPDDPYLHFNLGRVYVDSQKWPRAVSAAQKALELSPDFSEARKMADYAHKRV